MSIFMIAYEKYSGEDNNGRDYYDDTLDGDAGYFRTREAAQAYIDALNEADQTRWDEVYGKYKEKLDAEKAKVEKARAVLKEQGIPAMNLSYGWVSCPSKHNYITNRWVEEIEEAR